MNRRIPSWIALAAGGMLFAAAGVAQGQGSASGDNPQPSGTATAKQAQSGAPNATASTHHGAKHMKGKHRHARHGMSTSASGTRAAGGFDSSLDPAMSQCTSKTDRSARADCAREVWESKHGTS